MFRPRLVLSSVIARGALAGAIAVAFASGALATPVKTEHVEAELVAAQTAVVPGEPLTVALRLSMQKGWHTYWQNPGDSGLPTTLEWKLPAGVTAGPIEWPVPRALPAGPLVNYGYDGEVLHLVTLNPQSTLTTGTSAILRARADWLVCKEVCIPEGADLELALPIDRAATPDPKWATPIAAARAALPRPLEAWTASAEGKGATIEMKLVPPAGAKDPGALQFFSFAESRIEPSVKQTTARDGNAYVLTLPVSYSLSGNFNRLSGVLSAANGLSATAQAATIDVPLAGAVRAGAKPTLEAAPRLDLTAPASAPADNGLSLAVAIAFAFVGGIALNLMPCVFPVLTLKVLGFATHHDQPTTLRKEAFAFAAGVVVTFVALGLLLAGLRSGGEQLGWGFQLQSPAFVTALAALFFVLALNLSGVFEFGRMVPSDIAGFTAKNRTVDALASGVLAVLIASPCTAPFMGAALGYAISESTTVTLVVFIALGLGMAIPYVTLAVLPGWRTRLPRPGPWLARFKQVLAFPLYATVIWLAWVLGAQRDNDAVVRLLLALLCLGFALWTWHIVRTGGARPWGIAGIAALAGSLALAWPLFAAETNVSASASGGRRVAAGDGDWQPYTPARVAALTASGRPVFVDFTAAWCVTCQVNKRLVLNTQDVRAAFTRKNVALVRADWTRRDPDITRALTALGRTGVPVYVLYPPGGKPVLLPEVLQQQTVLEALASL
ncbi:MAG TPA: thioredoxin family protein [Casimicrobiaceae bacterium]|nr:thioredoxin family protein [Casimicrobiaceae bacterium]